MEVLIRPLRPDDLDGLFVLDYRSYAPAYRFGYQQLLLTLQQADVTTIVIEGEQKGDIIGGLIVRAERTARRIAIVSLMIAPEFRRSGLGTRLLNWSLEYAQRSGWDAVVVPIETDNAGAAAFLTAQGFQDTGTAQPYYAGPDVGTLWRHDVSEGEPDPSQSDAQQGAEEPTS